MAANTRIDTIDFNDTGVAFRSMSSLELQRARLLFKAFEFPWLVRQGPGLAAKAMDLHIPLAPLIRHTLFAQFCGGVTLEDCRGKVAELGLRGVRSVLDYGVEGLGREEDFDRTRDEILRSIQVAKQEPNIPFAVFKMTGLAPFAILEKVSSGETLSPQDSAAWERAKGRFRDLTEAAAEAGTRIMVDAEETWIQKAIDDLVHEAMARLNLTRPVVYNTVQMYRVGRLEYLGWLHQTGSTQGFIPAVKLVRGAYMEKERNRASRLGMPSPIQPSKAASDADYDAALRFIVDRIETFALFAGTHNEASCRLLAMLMMEKGLPRHHPNVEFSQLLGMSDNITFNLAHAGFHAAKYMPYGPVRAVMPYLGRRAAENSSIRGQAGRELAMIEHELKRRRKK
jgi:proline dehydrogenase